MQSLRLCLLIAGLALTGCATSPKPLPPPTRPLLDQYLASDCQQLPPAPTVDDFDLVLDWSTGLIAAYTDCAIRHRKTVDAWPK